MAWQNVRQHQAKRFRAAAALPTIGTIHPLTTKGLAAGLSGIVAAKKAVPVQGFMFFAAGAALLFE
jgi:phosphoribosylcarboxyaminoimidazole (NCAIR) mutase